jgi:hypothetical protein
MTGLLVLAVPVALTLGLSGGTVMLLLGYTRWGVANSQLSYLQLKLDSHQVITDCVTIYQLSPL